MLKTKQEVRKLAALNGIYLEEETISFNESGLDFQVAYATDLSNNQWVLRIPRRSDVLQSIDKERRTLQLVQPELSVQAPNWEIFSNELIAYKRLDGKPAGTIDHEAKAYIWELDEKNVPDPYHLSFAKGLVSLHNINTDDAKNIGLPFKTAKEYREGMKKRMTKVKEEFGVSADME